MSMLLVHAHVDAARVRGRVDAALWSRVSNMANNSDVYYEY